MEKSLLWVGDKVERRESRDSGVVEQVSRCSKGWFYVRWSDGYLGLHEISELKLIRRVEAISSYFSIAEILEGFRPDTPCEWADEAETVFLHLMAGWERNAKEATACGSTMTTP